MLAIVRRLKNGSLAAPDMVSFGAVPFGEQPARFHRQCGLALDAKRLPPHVRRIAERGREVTRLRREGGRAIAACPGEQQRRRCNRGRAINDRR